VGVACSGSLIGVVRGSLCGTVAACVVQGRDGQRQRTWQLQLQQRQDGSSANKIGVPTFAQRTHPWL
jgi:hypothetical protein